MIYVKKIDEQGFFAEDAFVEELTELTIEQECPQGFYHPKWDGGSWVEGLTQAEIDQIKADSKPSEPTKEELLTQIAELTAKVEALV